MELDIITIVLLGGVSIFGGIGSMVGVFSLYPARAQLAQRYDDWRHHRQYPDRRDRLAAHSLC
ncbi:MAG: hypothetical protein R2855_04630 [Thermomicrobiales bacterium]